MSFITPQPSLFSVVSLNSEEDTEEEDEEIEDDSSVLLPSMRIITKSGNITYITYL